MAQQPIPTDVREQGAIVEEEAVQDALAQAGAIGAQIDAETQSVISPPEEEAGPEAPLPRGLPQASNLMQAVSPQLLFNRDERKSPGEQDYDVSVLFEPLQGLPGASALTKAIFNRLRG